MCDPRDLQEVAQVRSRSDRPTIFVCGNQPGGVAWQEGSLGCTSGCSRQHETCTRCECPAGCPGCVGPGIGEHRSKAAALLLERVMAGLEGVMDLLSLFPLTEMSVSSS